MLKTTITLERMTSVKDTSGGAGRSAWATVSGMADVPADIQPASAGMQLNYSQRQLEVSHTIFLSQDIGAVGTDRITSGSRIFKIQGYRKAAPGRNQWPAVADVIEVAQS